MKTVAIIGAGKLGTTLGKALVQAGFPIAFLSCKTLPPAQESQAIISQGKPTTDNTKAAGSGQIIFLTVPDDSIESVGKELASSSLGWKGKLVFHCSGLLPAAILDPLRKKGAATGSFHPIQTFAQKNTEPSYFRNTYFGLEGDEEAVSEGWRLAQLIGGRPLLIHAEDKPVCHAAFSIASNFLIVLLDSALTLLKSTGLEERAASQIIFPLIQGSLHNIRQGQARSFLTGPVVRGDEKTIKTHLKILKKYPSLEDVYRKMGILALKIAEDERQLDKKKIKDLTRLLEDR